MQMCEKCLHGKECFLNKHTGGMGRECCLFLDISRFIELPCKYGDTVWCVADTRIIEATAFAATVYKDDVEIDLEFHCDTGCHDCPFSAWGQSYCGEWSCAGEYGDARVKASDFG